MQIEAEVLQEEAEKSVMDKPEKELSNLHELKKVNEYFFNYHLIGVSFASGTICKMLWKVFGAQEDGIS